MAHTSIGQFIAALRKVNGMTQQDLADRLGVSNKAVSRWERDECAPDLSLIPIIAEIFGITCDELLKGERIINEASSEKSEPKVKRQYKSLLNREISKFKTIMWVSIALALIGYICMFGISYGFYRPKIGFAVMLLLEVAAFATAAIGINRLKSESIDNEIFAAAEKNVTEPYHRALSSFSFTAFSVMISAVSISLPLICFTSSYVNSVLELASYLIFVILIAMLLYSVLKRSKAPFISRITGAELPSESNAAVRKLNLIQFCNAAAASLIFVYSPYLIVVQRHHYRMASANMVAVALLLINVIVFIVYIIKMRDDRKLLLLPGIRNMLLAVPTVLVSMSHDVVFTGTGTHHELWESYDVWSMEYIGGAIVIVIVIFFVFDIIDSLKKHKT